MSVASTRSAHGAAGPPIRWLFSPPGAAALATDTGTSQLLAGTQPFVITTPGDAYTLPPGWNAVRIVSFKSFAAIRNALESGTLAANVKGIMYDNEHWRFTPDEEQQNPAYYEKLSADLVHAHGLLFLTAPAVDLVAVLAPKDRKKQYDAYLRLGLAADAARNADAIDIQAQSAESNTELYANFVRQAAAQARQANPNVVVLAGISTNPNGQHVTADDLLRAIAATRDGVDGYWCNIPRPGVNCPHCNDYRPDIAIEVLHRLANRK